MANYPAITVLSVSRQETPLCMTRTTSSSITTTSPANPVYNHPSPTASCSGTATIVDTNASVPRNELFVATALDVRPGFASTTYAHVLAYIHLRIVSASTKLSPRVAHIEKNPHKNSIRQTTPTLTCISAAHPYPVTLRGSQTIASVALFKRIFPTPSLSTFRVSTHGYAPQGTIFLRSQFSSSSRCGPTIDHQSNCLQRSLIPSVSRLHDSMRHLPAPSERRTIPTESAPYP